MRLFLRFYLFYIQAAYISDGFLDTMDALGSNQDKQKKLAILKDSNSGAFAIIGGLVYILLYFAAMLTFNSAMKIYILAISICL